jgi:GNAT superfamily N-acetyltransferase
LAGRIAGAPSGGRFGVSGHAEEKEKENTIEIRGALAENAPAMAKVHVDSWQAAYRGIVPDSFLAEFTCSKREAAWREGMMNRAEETYLAEQNGTAGGLLTIGAGGDDDLDRDIPGGIWGICLSPNRWRKGIGTVLVKEAETRLKKRGCKEIVFWVLAENAGARKF